MNVNDEIDYPFNQESNEPKLKCPQCDSNMDMDSEDFRHNRIRLSEQKEIRNKGDQFKFNYRSTCPIHGKEYVQKTLKRK